MIDLSAEGWEPVRGLPRYEDFPEIQGRPIVHTRDFYVRDADRLVVEFDGGSYEPSAVLLNGVELKSYGVLRKGSGK